MKPTLGSFARFYFWRQKWGWGFLTLATVLGGVFIVGMHILYQSVAQNLSSQIARPIESNELLIKPKGGIVSAIIGWKNNPLNSAFLESLQAENSEVKNIYKTLYLTIPLSGSVELFGKNIQSDLFVVGIDPERLEGEIPREKFRVNESEKYVPLVVSRFLAQMAEQYLYNNLSETENLISEGFLSTLQGELHFGKSTLFESDYSSEIQNYQSRIVGYSRKTPVFFLGIPLHFSEKMYREYEGHEPVYSEIILQFKARLSSDAILAWKNKLAPLNLQVFSYDEVQPLAGTFLQFFSYTLIGISTMIVFFVWGILWMLLRLFWMQSERDIATFLALGASRGWVWQLFVLQLGGLLLLSVVLVLGILCFGVWAGNLELNQILSGSFFISEGNFFVWNINSVFLLLGYGALLFFVGGLWFWRRLCKVRFDRVVR